MKKVLLSFVFMCMALMAVAQNYFETPADTVYLRNGRKAVVHIKSIENPEPERHLGYQIKTHESMEMIAQDVWAQGTGGYSWVSEKYREGWWGYEIDKIVFADGFILPFENGQIDRSLLLKSPRYDSSHGDILAEGVVELNREETRTIIGDKAYYLGYDVYKRQARVGLATTAIGVPGTFICYLKRDLAVKKADFTPSLVGAVGYSSCTMKKMNATWQTVMPFMAVTTVFGVVEMMTSNSGVSRIARDYKNFTGPGEAASKRRLLVGGGLVLAGAAVTYLGYKKIKDHGVWYTLYKDDNVAGTSHSTKAGTKGNKPSVPWLLPAAGALLFNFGVADLTYGFNGLRGHRIIRNAGLERAELHIGAVSGGIGLCLNF